MVRLREIPRTATFAWSPFPATSPFIVTGTRSGAVDASFSSETALEIWDLGLDSRTKEGTEIAQPVGRCMTDSGFNDIAWAQSEDASYGIIAGALENGALDLWSADKLLHGHSDALISRNTQHSEAVKTLQFNPKHPNLLASAGSKAELFVCDLNNADSAFRLGNRVARSDDIDCLDWNRRVPHILVTGSSGGFVTVWDVKTKKETLTLSNLNRRPVSAIAWDPERPTKLITGTPSETEPIICLWDLRNSNAPERILKGHENGVLDLAWCAQDPRLLISCGMDDRTLAWNPETGEKYGEYPIVTNWTFQTRFNPHNPNIFGTASFDGKIAVQTLQNTCTKETEAGAAEHTDGEDFFNKAQSQPQVSTFSLPAAPRWYERPVGATFGFGGKVISIGLVKGTRTSQIKITPFEVDSDITTAAEKFDKALGAGDLRSICEERIQSAQTEEEKADWKVIETLIAKAPKKKLVEYLGISDSADETADSLSKLGLGPPASSTGTGAAGTDSPMSPGTPPNGGFKPSKRHKRIASIFEPSSESAHFLSDLTLTKSVKSNDPFHILSGQESDTDRSITRALMLGDFNTALDVALKQDRVSDAFMIAICGGEECVRRAQEYYLTRPKAEGEIVPSYSRLLGSIAGRNLWDVVHNADLANWREAVATICTYADTDGDGTGKQFEDLCEVLGDRLVEEFVRSGGERGEAGDKQGYRKDASFCYLISSKLEKVVSLWIEELQEFEARNIQTEMAGTGSATAAASSSFSIHAHALQDLIEKVTVFRSVTNFEDPDRLKESDWKLAQLYEKYVEYANIIASHGCMNVAEKYLQLLPPAHPEAKVAMDRIKLATRPAASPAARGQVTAGGAVPAAAAVGDRTTPAGARVQRPAAAATATPVAANPYAPQTTYVPATAVSPAAPTTTAPAPMAAGVPPNPYSPAAATTAATARNPYAPATASATPASNPYAPTAGHVPANPYAPAAGSGYGMSAAPSQRGPSSVPPPPRQYGSISSATSGVALPPTGTSYANASNLPAWNDIPNDLAKKSAAPRRGTPTAIASPYAPAPAVGMQSAMGMGMPGAGTVKSPSRGPAAVPPPPKGPAPPPRIASPPSTISGPRVHPAPPVVTMQPPVSQVPPPPAAVPANPYAPPPPQAGVQEQSPYSATSTPASQVPRGPSPYNAPPSVSPMAAPSRYAPAPAPMPDHGPSQVRAASPYTSSEPGPVAAPVVPGQDVNAAMGVSPHGTPVMQQSVPAQVSRPPTAQSQRKATPKYPPGDRTHIPENALPVYEILSADMQRVKARAPSSFKAQVNDTERRLNILFDHLNNEDLLKPDTINSMLELAQAVQARDYNLAHSIHLEILTNKMDECGNWMVGVKRLIGMSRATP